MCSSRSVAHKMRLWSFLFIKLVFSRHFLLLLFCGFLAVCYCSYCWFQRTTLCLGIWDQSSQMTGPRSSAIFVEHTQPTRRQVNVRGFIVMRCQCQLNELSTSDLKAMQAFNAQTNEPGFEVRSLSACHCAIVSLSGWGSNHVTGSLRCHRCCWSLDKPFLWWPLLMVKKTSFVQISIVNQWL